VSARRVLSLVGLVALVALVVSVFVSTAATAAFAAPPPQRPHPVLGPAPGLRTLKITTIPAVAGATFTFEGQTITTGKDGVATTTITQEQRDRLSDPVVRNDAIVVTSSSVSVAKDVRANFSGWYGNGSYKEGVETQTATFSFDYLTSFVCMNKKGDPVQPSLLQSMQLKSSVGATIDLKSPDPVWLEGRRVTPGSGGVDVRDISYRINTVKVAGSNVVNSAQQQFFPTRRTTATVKLLFFSVRFVATDAMFGGGVGKKINLEYPDGKIRTFTLGSQHSVTVDDLPRGDYHVTVLGGGLRMARPLNISRNQQADLDVITYLDVGLVVLVLAVVAAAVLWYGLVLRRRHKGVGRRDARVRHPAIAPDATAAEAGLEPAPGDTLPPLIPVPAPANGNGHGDGTGVYVHEEPEGNDLEFLTASTVREETRPEPVDPGVVAEAFADADAHAERASAPSERVVRDPDEVSANEQFLVEGPDRRRR
jgi:hypothetical protein